MKITEINGTEPIDNWIKMRLETYAKEKLGREITVTNIKVIKQADK